jgi:exodeoxyribonuclease-3
MTAPFSLLTWNVNSVRARLDNVLTYLDEADADIVCLQETRVEDRLFPRVPFMELGYQVTLNGTKGYAGVATLTKQTPEEVQRGFRDPPEDRHRRILALRVNGVTVYNLYAPNGTALDSENFPYKLDWYARLRAELDAHHGEGEVIVCGDFNVIPEARDVWDPEAFEGRLHYTQEERDALAGLVGFGLHDCFRKHEQEGGRFTFFEYQRRSWERRHGMRIDHIYATQASYERCTGVVQDLEPRDWEGASDHAPVIARFG